MAKKVDNAYAPFSFSLTDLAQGYHVHEGQEGMVLVFQDQIAAYDQWDKLKQISGPRLSVFGCGPNADQHINLPTCTGMMHLQIPAGVLPPEVDKRVCVMSDKLPVGPGDVKIQPEWIRQVDFRIEGDIAHGPLVSMQLTEGVGVDYRDLQRFAQQRLSDLSRITTKIAIDSQEVRMRADLQDEFVRDSLNAMYCSSGFVYHRQRYTDQMTPEQRAMAGGLETLQQYMKAMDANLGIDAILRHAHTMEQEFRDLFPAQYAAADDAKVAISLTIAQIMQAHADKATTADERVTFLSFKANAEHYAEMFKAEGDIETPGDEQPETPVQNTDSLDDR